MAERHLMWCQRLPVNDRQMLTAAYLPVIAFGIALIAGRISRTHRHQSQVAR